MITEDKDVRSLARAIAFLELPLGNPPGKDNDVLQTAALLPTQSLEDHQLTKRIEHALRATGYGALRSVEVSVNARIVTLTGPVPSYHLKQAAQEAARAVPGAHQIRNGLSVGPREPTPQGDL